MTRRLLIIGLLLAVALPCVAMHVETPQKDNTPPLYVRAFFRAQNMSELKPGFGYCSYTLLIGISRDAKNWRIVDAAGSYADPYQNSPAVPIVSVKDPSIMYYQGNWWVVYTAKHTGVGGAVEAYLGLASSPDLVNWTWVSHIRAAGIAFERLWAPEWFTDPVDNIPRIVVWTSMAFAAACQDTYILEPSTPLALQTATWIPTKITQAGGADVHTGDPWMTKADGYYYLWGSSGLYRSLDRAANYTFIAGSNGLMDAGDTWATLNDTSEGFSAIQISNGHWRAWIDNGADDLQDANIYPLSRGGRYVDWYGTEAGGNLFSMAGWQDSGAVATRVTPEGGRGATIIIGEVTAGVITNGIPPTVGAPGAGYTVGDDLTLLIGDRTATCNVDTIDANGGVTGVTLLGGGTCYYIPSNTTYDDGCPVEPEHGTVIHVTDPNAIANVLTGEASIRSQQGQTAQTIQCPLVAVAGALSVYYRARRDSTRIEYNLTGATDNTKVCTINLQRLGAHNGDKVDMYIKRTGPSCIIQFFDQSKATLPAYNDPVIPAGFTSDKEEIHVQAFCVSDDQDAPYGHFWYIKTPTDVPAAAPSLSPTRWTLIYSGDGTIAHTNANYTGNHIHLLLPAKSIVRGLLVTSKFKSATCAGSRNNKVSIGSTVNVDGDLHNPVTDDDYLPSFEFTADGVALEYTTPSATTLFYLATTATNFNLNFAHICAGGAGGGNTIYTYKVYAEVAHLP